MRPDAAAPAGMAAAGPLYDFCLWPYAPLSDPAGKRPFSDLLELSFGLSEAPAALADVSRRCVEAFGRNATVWGIKWDGARLSWELYFYDYARLDRRVSLEAVRRVLDVPAWRALPVMEHVPYFMCSVELDARARFTPSVDLYVGTPGSEVSAGLCYACGPCGPAFKNIYYFFDAKRQHDEILDKLACSMHLTAGAGAPQDLLWPQTRQCETLVVANKRLNDGIYYSRVNVGQTLWFMRRMGYPAAICDHLARNVGDFAHLLFDLGVDFRAAPGRVDFFRGAFYGVV